MQVTKSFAELFSARAASECPVRCSQTLYLSHIARNRVILSQWPVNTDPASAKTSNGVALFNCVSSANRRSNAETSIVCLEPNMVLCGIGLMQ